MTRNDLHQTTMKCDKCEKPATFHITELTGSDPMELHLCADHAQQYLSPDEAEQESPSLAAVLTQPLKVGKTAEEMARLDKLACPVCGITFYEFRKGGRLGCPYDYTCFAEQLEILIVNIHGASTHTGKRPERGAGNAERQMELLKLRREMKNAVDREEYERASQLRDRIQQIQQES